MSSTYDPDVQARDETIPFTQICDRCGATVETDVSDSGRTLLGWTAGPYQTDPRWKDFCPACAAVPMTLSEALPLLGLPVPATLGEACNLLCEIAA